MSNSVVFNFAHLRAISSLIFVSKSTLLFGIGKVTISYLRKAVQVRNRGYDFVCVKSRLGGCSVYRSCESYRKECIGWMPGH